MRVLSVFIPFVSLAFLAGCNLSDGNSLPSVSTFTGKVTQNGNPIAVPQGSGIQLKLQLETDSTKSFGIPLAPDGTFKIGAMPIGKYVAFMEKPPTGGKGPPGKYTIPGGFTIVEGKTDYTVEVGSGWKP